MSSYKKADQRSGIRGAGVHGPHDYKAHHSALDPLFEGEIDYLIRMIRMREVYAIELMLRPVGLTLSAWYPLAVLHVEDGMSQRELGKRLNLKDAAIGKAIDALESEKLIVRKKDPNDRRKALVCLTAKGRKIAYKVAKQRHEFQSVFVEGFSQKERSLFGSLLERSYDNLEKFLATFE